jgi:hypothetical protein
MLLVATKKVGRSMAANLDLLRRNAFGKRFQYPNDVLVLVAGGQHSMMVRRN